MTSQLPAIPNLFNPDLRMSSVEIAELTGRRHDNVLRDIRDLRQDIENAGIKDISSEVRGSNPSETPLLNIPISLAAYNWETLEEGEYLDAYGRSQPCFLLPLRPTVALVAGYNRHFTLEVVHRWATFEEKIHNPQNGAIETCLFEEILEKKGCQHGLEVFVEACLATGIMKIAYFLKDPKTRVYYYKFTENGEIYGVNHVVSEMKDLYPDNFRAVRKDEARRVGCHYAKRSPSGYNLIEEYRTPMVMIFTTLPTFHINQIDNLLIVIHNAISC